MKYNPNIHHRRSIRLKGYDYSQVGAYFITICCHDMICRFGKVGASLADAQKEISDAPNEISSNQKSEQPSNNTQQMILNEFGQIAYDEWIKLPERFSNFDLDVFQIMPNHMHGIIVIKETVGNEQSNIGQPDLGQANLGQSQGIALTNCSVGDIVGAYKSLVGNACLENYKMNCVRVGVAPAPLGKIWHRNYYEHIIRDEKAYENISNYIINNPANWNGDKFFRK